MFPPLVYKIAPWTLLVVVAWACWHDIQQDLAHPHPHTVRVLSAPGVFDVPVAATRADLSEMSRAPGPVNGFRVPVETPVTVLSEGPFAAEVQLPDGRRGWVFHEWVVYK